VEALPERGFSSGARGLLACLESLSVHAGRRLKSNVVLGGRQRPPNGSVLLCSSIWSVAILVEAV